MSDRLQIHAASSAERAAAFRNFHDIWGGGLSVEEHVRRRLTYPKYDNAQWYVGCLDERVVAGCGCYSFEFSIDGRIEPAYALGEVHTLSEFRGRGFAPQLLAYVEEEQRNAGKTLGVLYSDISPAYYERLGWILCSCPQGWADGENIAASATQSTTCTRFDPNRELSTIAELYQRYHERFPLWVARSRRYWEYLIGRDPDDEFYFVESHRTRVGYFRAAITADEFKIRDFALVDEHDETCRSALRGILTLAGQRQAKRVGGWMPGTGPHAELFRMSERGRELTMVKPLVPRLAIGPQHREAAQFLHEIDHV